MKHLIQVILSGKVLGLTVSWIQLTHLLLALPMYTEMNRFLGRGYITYKALYPRLVPQYFLDAQDRCSLSQIKNRANLQMSSRSRRYNLSCVPMQSYFQISPKVAPDFKVWMFLSRELRSIPVNFQCRWD